VWRKGNTRLQKKGFSVHNNKNQNSLLFCHHLHGILYNGGVAMICHSDWKFICVSIALDSIIIIHPRCEAFEEINFLVLLMFHILYMREETLYDLAPRMDARKMKSKHSTERMTKSIANEASEASSLFGNLCYLTSFKKL
jgi:hypothetical protein